MTGEAVPEQPFLEVLAGDPTDEETAAIAVVLQQLQLEQAAYSLPLPVEPHHSGWVRAGGAVRRPLDRRGGWQGA